MTHAEINILSTIRPIYFLVEGINLGINTNNLLVDGRVSPHDYQPKPSDIKKIVSADIIFRIDESFQPRLTKIVKSNGEKSTVISLAENKNITLLPNQVHLNEHEEEEHEEDGEHEEEEQNHSHGSGGFDLHIWLSPLNAIKISDNIALELSKLDPKNREKYQYNAKQQALHLKKLDLALHKKLQPLQRLDFFSYHDAYGNFTNRFNLNHSLAITPTLNHQLSAKRIQQIVNIAAEKNVNCIMLEPQFNNKYANIIANSRPAIHVGTWDPLGFELELRPNSFHKLLSNMADSLRTCLMP